MGHLSSMCHGLRCDMSMLLLGDVFRTTWAGYLDAGEKEWEFWSEAIDRLKSEGNAGLLIAEAYWGKEAALLSQGFDYVYDKTFYDIILGGNVPQLKKYLSRPVSGQEKMLRFLENHDEQRAITAFGYDRIKCAMVIHATLPGIRLWHQGQLEGYKIRVPVQLKRAPNEPKNMSLEVFSENLIRIYLPGAGISIMRRVSWFPIFLQTRRRVMLRYLQKLFLYPSA